MSIFVVFVWKGIAQIFNNWLIDIFHMDNDFKYS